MTVKAGPVMRYMEATASALNHPHVYVRGVLGDRAGRRASEADAMTRIVPHPLLTGALVVMWLLLNRFSLGHLLLGTAVALVAGRAMAALEPVRPRIRRWDLVLRLFADRHARHRCARTSPSPG